MQFQYQNDMNNNQNNNMMFQGMMNNNNNNYGINFGNNNINTGSKLMYHFNNNKK